MLQFKKNLYFSRLFIKKSKNLNNNKFIKSYYELINNLLIFISKLIEYFFKFNEQNESNIAIIYISNLLEKEAINNKFKSYEINKILMMIKLMKKKFNNR